MHQTIYKIFDHTGKWSDAENTEVWTKISHLDKIQLKQCIFAFLDKLGTVCNISGFWLQVTEIVLKQTSSQRHLLENTHNHDWAAMEVVQNQYAASAGLVGCLIFLSLQGRAFHEVGRTTVGNLRDSQFLYERRTESLFLICF